MTADLQPDLERIIRVRDFSALRGKLENWEPADLVSLIVSLPVEDQVIGWLRRVNVHWLRSG